MKVKKGFSAESRHSDNFDAVHFRHNHTGYTSYNHVHVVDDSVSFSIKLHPAQKYFYGLCT